MRGESEGGVGVGDVMGDGLMHTGRDGGGGGRGVGGTDAMIYSLNSPTRSSCLFADPQQRTRKALKSPLISSLLKSEWKSSTVHFTLPGDTVEARRGNFFEMAFFFFRFLSRQPARP